MKQIPKIALDRFNVGAHYNFHLESYAFLEKNAKIKQNLNELLKRYKECIAHEDLTMNIVKSNERTSLIKKSDRERSLSLTALKKTVEGYAIHDEAEYRNSSAKIIGILKENSFKKADSIDSRTGLCVNLLDDLKKHCTDDITRLNAGWLVEKITRLNTFIRSNMSLRTEEYAVRSKGSSKNARMMTDKAYKELVAQVNAKSVSDNYTHYADFSDTIDKMVAHIDRQKKYVTRQRIPAETEPGKTVVPAPGTSTPTPPPPSGSGQGEAPDPSA